VARSAIDAHGGDLELARSELRKVSNHGVPVPAAPRVSLRAGGIR
jgi:hypothetical protein